MKHLKLVLTLFLGYLLAGCNKIEEPKTRTDILQYTTWMVESAQATGYLTGQIYKRGVTAEGSPYDMSKIRVSFYSNGTISAIDNTGNAQKNGKWTLTENDTKIVISSADNELLNGLGNINSLTTAEFTFSGERLYKSELVKATVRMIPAQ